MKSQPKQKTSPSYKKYQDTNVLITSSVGNGLPYNNISIPALFERMQSELKPTKKFSTKNNAYGTIYVSFKSADYSDFFFHLTAHLAPFLWEDKFIGEAIQYNHFYTAIAAKEARNEYFFPGKGQRKLVVSSPDECISLLQLTYDPELMIVNAHIRSSDLILFPWDLLFIFSLPYACAKRHLAEEMRFIITFSNLHRGNRSPGKKKKTYLAYAPLSFVLDVQRTARLNK